MAENTSGGSNAAPVGKKGGRIRETPLIRPAHLKEAQTTLPIVLEEPDCVSQAHTSAYLRGYLLNERQVIEIQSVAQIKPGHRNYMSRVLLRDCV